VSPYGDNDELKIDGFIRIKIPVISIPVNIIKIITIFNILKIIVFGIIILR